MHPFYNLDPEEPKTIRCWISSQFKKVNLEAKMGNSSMSINGETIKEKSQLSA